ncbi:hypothetical protein SDC9_90495 [bioreactor metagenome]|uniref:Uncharacterized protein n=1 Tax=bioreactor metagenome TaxID=1076179 RepID=A0A644ZTU6_9ZZZZ
MRCSRLLGCLGRGGRCGGGIDLRTRVRRIQQIAVGNIEYAVHRDVVFRLERAQSVLGRNAEVPVDLAVVIAEFVQPGLHAFHVRSAVVKLDLVRHRVRAEEAFLQLAGCHAVHGNVERALKQRNGGCGCGIVNGGGFVRIEITEFDKPRLQLLNRRVVVVFLKNRIVRNLHTGGGFRCRLRRKNVAGGCENFRFKRNRRGRNHIVGARGGNVYRVCARAGTHHERYKNKRNRAYANQNQNPGSGGVREQAAGSTAGAFASFCQARRFQCGHLVIISSRISPHALHSGDHLDSFYQ